jgi:hypothetical protein
MSHFTHIKTRFQNLLYLEKALSKLNITYKQQHKSIDNSKTNLVISQSNGYDIEFYWNGQEYELVVDMSFWEQPYPIENFMDKIAQQYAGEVLLEKVKKLVSNQLNTNKMLMDQIH